MLQNKFPRCNKKAAIKTPLTGFKYIIKIINCELTIGLRDYLQMMSKKKGRGSAKVDMGFPLERKRNKMSKEVDRDDDSIICEWHDSNCIEKYKY